MKPKTPKKKTGDRRSAKSERGNGIRYPLSWIASEFAIDRKGLQLKLEARGVDCAEGVSLKEAFEAEVDRAAAKKDRERLLKSEANQAEMDEAEKAGALMKKSECHRLIAELAVESRKLLEGAEYIPKVGRVRLSKELAKIKVQ